MKSLFIPFSDPEKCRIGLISGKTNRGNAAAKIDNRDRHAAADAELRRFFENLSP
ncbi:hypothetical protein X729_31665 [Mesorhizobium sp. L103C131B0]|nr:hypothetical protein X729_31665 [Mesorhizobium sp. L103C131B0]